MGSSRKNGRTTLSGKPEDYLIVADKVTFGEIRQLLNELGFVQIPARRPAVLYEHKESDTLLIFRPHRLNEPVDAVTLAVVRKFLDEKGLLAASARLMQALAPVQLHQPARRLVGLIVPLVQLGEDAPRLRPVAQVVAQVP